MILVLGGKCGPFSSLLGSFTSNCSLSGSSGLTTKENYIMHMFFSMPMHRFRWIEHNHSPSMPQLCRTAFNSSTISKIIQVPGLKLCAHHLATPPGQLYLIIFAKTWSPKHSGHVPWHRLMVPLLFENTLKLGSSFFVTACTSCSDTYACCPQVIGLRKDVHVGSGWLRSSLYAQLWLSDVHVNLNMCAWFFFVHVFVIGCCFVLFYFVLRVYFAVITACCDHYFHPDQHANFYIHSLHDNLPNPMFW